MWQQFFEQYLHFFQLPVTITLPFDSKISLTELIKSLLTDFCRFFIAKYSSLMTDIAVFRILSLIFNYFLLKKYPVDYL